jgi:hypothetical protein
MGLFSKVLGLPLAPVAGVVWLAEKLEAEARRQLSEPHEVYRQLAELEELEARGEVSAAERRRAEEALLEAFEQERLRDG